MRTTADMATVSTACLATTQQKGQPFRFMAGIILLWAIGRIAMATDILSFGFPQGQAQDRLTPNIIEPAKPKHDIYYGEIARLPLPRPATTLKNIPIITTRSRQPLQAGRAQWAIVTHNDQANPQPSQQLNVIITHAGLALLPVAALAASDSTALSRPPTIPDSPEHSSPNRPQRWSASAWLFWREKGRANNIGSAGQLGGPQAGIRVERRLATIINKMPVAAYARASSALRRPHAPEAALGIALKPIAGRIPVTFGIERRIALDTYGRNAFALVAASGLNPTHVTDTLIAEGYVQAGLVGFSRADAFIDGRISLGAALDTKKNMLAGLSLSGGAQPHVSRLDIGPMVQWRLPVKTMNSRLTVEWRQRIAGNARPGSGLTATLASDF